MDEGKELIRRERRRRQKNEDGGKRTSAWRERYGAQGASGWRRAGYTEIKDSQDGAITETNRHVGLFAGRGGETEEEQTGLLQDISTDEISPTKRSKEGRYLSLSPSQTGIFDDV